MGKRIARILFFMGLIGFMITFSGCDKDEQISDILTSKSWKRGMVDLNTSTNPPGDHSYYPLFDCDTDDKYTFQKDGILVIERGTNKCEQDEESIERLHYSIDRENNELIIDSTRYLLAEESETQIKYYKMVPAGGTNSLLKNMIFLLQ